MPYANNQGVRIYYEVEGQGPPLVLAHGGTEGLSVWRGPGYVEALKNDFQLILFDFRGCGRSDKPREASAFDRKLMDNDVLAILDNLGIAKAHYFGYSGGAMTGWLLAARHAERFHSFIIGGMSPYSFPEAMVRVFKEIIEGLELKLTNPEAYLQRQERRFGRSLTPEERNLLLAEDAEVLIPLLTTSIDWQPLNDHDLASISLPCLVYCGDLDPFHTGAKESVNHMPQARFVSLPGLDHLTTASRSDLALPHIKKFLAGLSKT
jgi:pimeloyl-ACP methyl ester carboxylesterase